MEATTRRAIMFEKKNFIIALDKIHKLQDEADSVNEQSADWEVKIALTKHHEALGAMNNMVTLGLLTALEFESLAFKHHKTSEKFKLLHEKRTQGTANTKEPIRNKTI